MKHKQSSGFAIHLLLILILIVAAVGLTGWYVYEHHRSPSDSVNNSNNWAPNEISVTFKDGTTYAQASDLMKSYGLTIENADTAEGSFIPRSWRGIKDADANEVIAKLNTYPEVKSAFDDSADPANNRAGKDEKWLEVIWQENTTFNRIKQIQVATGYGLSTQPGATYGYLWVDVPTGQEDSFVKKLKQSPIVQDASRMGKVILQ